MTSYINLILEMLQGETPKQKFEHLQNCLITLQKIAYPRRGSDEEGWDIQVVADNIIAGNLIDQHKSY